MRGRFRQKFDMRDRFAIYVGRIDENKGCVELFDFFEHYSATLVDGMHLVLIGTAHVPIPKHPRIHHLGFVDDQDKYDAMAAAEVLIMPSYLESLSMVALEAWAMGKPVLANAKCDVLQGQCLRSNAGLFYANYPEFVETLRAIDTTPSLQAALGRNGRTFFERHYAWPVIVKKYVDMLQQLSKTPAKHTMEPMPGWLTRRRGNLPAADSIVKQLPIGPYRGTPPVSAPRPAGTSQRPPVSSPRPAGSTPQQQSGRPNQRPASQQQRPAHGPASQQQRPPQGPVSQRQRPPQGSAPQQQRPPQGEGTPQQQRPERGDKARPDRGRDPRRRPHRRGRRPGGPGGR